MPALENTPTDIDSKMMLAVINEDLGNMDLAKQLTDEGIQLIS